MLVFTYHNFNVDLLLHFPLQTNSRGSAKSSMSQNIKLYHWNHQNDQTICGSFLVSILLLDHAFRVTKRGVGKQVSILLENESE